MTMNATDMNSFRRFVEGLREYNLTYDEILNSKWRYAGGNGDYTSYSTMRHYNYFKLCFPDMDPLPHRDRCVCRHHIQENCYISDFEGNFITIGNCCIKKFIPLGKRTCAKCYRPHRNRKVNECNACRGVKGKVYEYQEHKQVPKWNWKKWTWTNDFADLTGIIRAGKVGVEKPIDIIDLKM